MLVRQQEDGAHRLHRDAGPDSLLAQRLQPCEQVPAKVLLRFDDDIDAVALSVSNICPGLKPRELSFHLWSRLSPFRARQPFQKRHMLLHAYVFAFYGNTSTLGRGGQARKAQHTGRPKQGRYLPLNAKKNI